MEQPKMVRAVALLDADWVGDTNRRKAGFSWSGLRAGLSSSIILREPEGLDPCARHYTVL